MSKCKKCGNKLPARVEFCPECGECASVGRNARILLIIAWTMMIGLVLVFSNGCSGGAGEQDDDGQSVPAAARKGDYTGTASREKYTRLQGGGEDEVTVMFYIIGSDLESSAGCATDDIVEIIDADMSDKLNLVIQTGGASAWQNEVVSADSCERYLVTDGDLEFLEDAGAVSMAEVSTLSDFISFAAQSYPADRYQLILWNHGGGTMSGFGYDENYGQMLTLADIDSALGDAGVKFDMIGFDACLMATVETAVMLEPYADYLIASEELEPGAGWYYTDFLSSLAQNTSIDTVELGKQIVDDYVDSYDWSTETTLSVVDLTMIMDVNARLNEFMDASESILIDNSAYKTFSNARAGARSYGEGSFEQIDIVDYVMQTGLSEGEKLIGAIDSAVKYYGGSLDSSYGLAMYFPYEAIEYYEDIAWMLDEIGMGDDYTDFFNQFLTILGGGQMNFGGQSISPLEELIGGIYEEMDFGAYDWFEEDTAQSYEYEACEIESEKEIVEKGDGYVLQMSDEQWQQVVGIELQVWYDDGEGYIDLGSDSMYEFDEDGDLMISFDNLWVAINGQIVSFYTEREEDLGDGRWYSYGYVPCFVNDEQMELVVCWNNEQENGYVAGYRSVATAGGHASKGVIPLAPGDVVDFISDYYTYDGEYQDWYYIGESITFDGSEWQVSYEDVGANDCLVFYMLTDIYQNNYYTEALQFYSE